MSESSLLILAREFKKLRDDTRRILGMPVGPQGERGEKGERGDQGIPGSDGVDGRDGTDGRDGRDGKDAKPAKDGKSGEHGAPGKDGTSITDVDVDFDGHLRVTLSTGKIIDAGEIPVEKVAGGVHVAGNAWQITVSEIAPENPQLNQLWLDIS